MYMAAGNMDKDMFCAEYKKVGTSVLVTELFRQVLVLKGNSRSATTSWMTRLSGEPMSRSSLSGRLQYTRTTTAKTSTGLHFESPVVMPVCVPSSNTATL